MSIFRYSGKRLSDSYKREPNISTEEWAARNVYFTGTDVSPITGAFQIKYSPHLKKLFALVDIPRVHKLFAKWASQSAKSLFEMIVAGKILDTEPTNILYMQPIKDDIPKIVDIKIDPLLKCMKNLWKKFEDYKFNESIRGKREMKRIAGGGLIISGSSVKERKSLTVPKLLMDEIGEFEEGAVEEAEERTKAFSKFFPKIIGVSTIVHPTDEICTNYDTCEAKLEWHYICPSCKDNFYPGYDTFKWLTREQYMKRVGIEHEEEVVLKEHLALAKKEVHVECPHCKYKITSEEKDRMILNEGMDWFYIEGDETATSYGVDMNSLGSYFVPFELLAEKLINANDSDTKLDKIHRGWFNKFYKRKVVEKEQDDMLLLGNGVEQYIVPKDTVKIYLTIDNQKDHLYAQITAIRYGLSPHIMYFGRLESWLDAAELWEKCQFLEDKEGERYVASKMGVDRRGYNEGEISRTREADIFVNEMAKVYGEDRIFGMEGHPDLTGGKPLTVVNHKDYSNKEEPMKIRVVKFSNIYIKDQLFGMIDRGIQKARNEEGTENWEIRLFSINQTQIEQDKKGTTNESLTKMLTAEVLGFAEDKRGKKATVETYIPIRKRNDAIDTTNMALVFADMDKLVLAKKPENTNIKDALSTLTEF